MILKKMSVILTRHSICCESLIIQTEPLNPNLLLSRTAGFLHTPRDVLEYLQDDLRVTTECRSEPNLKSINFRRASALHLVP